MKSFFVLWSPINRYLAPTVIAGEAEARQKALDFCRDHGGVECFVLQAIARAGIDGDPRQIEDLTP